MFDFDRRVGKERKQFATQVAVMDKTLLKVIKAGFDGDKSLEFYEGLLAGYACSYKMIDSLPLDDQKAIIGGLLAYISEILEERT